MGLGFIRLTRVRRVAWRLWRSQKKEGVTSILKGHGATAERYYHSYEYCYSYENEYPGLFLSFVTSTGRPVAVGRPRRDTITH